MDRLTLLAQHDQPICTVGQAHPALLANMASLSAQMDMLTLLANMVSLSAVG